MNLKHKKFLVISIGIVVGLIAGFLYWKKVGCASGTCPLTSHWYSTTAVGGVLGYLFSDIFASKIKGEK
jgi:hypothetical protein